MFKPAHDLHFSLSIENFTHDLQMLAFKGQEGLGQPSSAGSRTSGAGQGGRQLFQSKGWQLCVGGEPE